jgi:hypothetical protein
LAIFEKLSACSLFKKTRLNQLEAKVDVIAVLKNKLIKNGKKAKIEFMPSIPSKHIRINLVF